MRSETKATHRQNKSGGRGEIGQALPLVRTEVNKHFQIMAEEQQNQPQ